jgi:hypothetical protein
MRSAVVQDLAADQPVLLDFCKTNSRRPRASSPLGASCPSGRLP